MSEVFVRFWGTRGSIPTPSANTRKYGGNTPCIEIRFGDRLLICDGGSGLRDLGLALDKRMPGGITGHLFFSHAHWDHIQGFPFFLPAYREANTFFVYGTKEGDTRAFDLLSGQMRSEYFPVNFSDLRAHILPAHIDGGRRPVQGVEVRYFEQRHPGGSLGYSFAADGRKIVYSTDNEIDLTLADPGQAIANPTAPRRIPEALVRFCADADLLVADGQYFDTEYPQKSGWGHARATTVVDLAIQARVRQVAIFHHDPMHSDLDIERKLAICRARAERVRPELTVFAAREGLEMKF